MPDNGSLDPPKPRAFGLDIGAGGTRGLMEYVRVLYKRRALALCSFGGVVLLAGLYALGRQPVYEARTQLLIEVDNPKLVSFKDVEEVDNQSAEFYQTQYTILKSRSLARRTIESLGLWKSPLLGGAPPPHTVSRLGRVRQGLTGLVERFEIAAKAGSVDKPEAPAADETAGQSRAIDGFLHDLTVSPIKDSRLVDVKFQTVDPTMAAKIANAFAQAYIAQNLELRFTASKEATDWLSGQLDEQKKQVEQSQKALQQYRETSNATPSGDRENTVTQQMSSLSELYSRAKAARIQRETLYKQLRAAVADNTIDSAPIVLSSQFIQQLKAEQAELQRRLAEGRQQLLDEHPDIKRLHSALDAVQLKITAEINKLVMSAQNEVTTAIAEENNLAQAIDAQKVEVTAMNRKAIEYDALERDARSNQQIFDNLLQRTKETGISGELKTSNIHVVDPAEIPRSPVKTRNDFLLAVCGGVVLSLGLTFFAEHIDSRIKSPEEIRAALSLPCLGLVPRIRAGAAGERTPLVGTRGPGSDGDPSPQFSEALRTLRTNVVFAAASVAGPRIVLVTSTGPKEGKSTVATNLAIVLAQGGAKTLLVDADLRRPRQHRMFSEPQVPGLTDLLHDQPAERSLRDSGVPGLTLLPAGTPPDAPADVLGSPRFTALLKALAHDYDWVIVDAPPVMAVTDASIVAHAATGVLFVVAADRTRAPQAQTALEQLASAQAHFFGAVLNGVDLARHPFFFARYYRREYEAYYTVSRTA